ncbi:hypothetical protein Sste5346_007671 [Sporothrix stenoceras]|uniref:CFEM domain-containing protein n=1 Tax=Sporothrix stenoceras TaxID=5173 RepID=A0ABR3YT24_9PEZI
MRSQNSLVFALAALAGIAKSQSFPDEASLPGCGQTCLDQVISEASTFGCTADSVGCLCAAPNFQNGVHDCAAAACAADLLASVTNYVIGVCATAVVSAPAATSTPVTSAPVVSSTPPPAVSSTPSTPPVSSTPTPVTSSSIATSAPPTTSSVPPTSTSTPVTSSTPTPVTSSSATSNALVAPTSTAQSTTAAPTTTSATTSTPANTISSAASSTSTASAGLTAGAKAGIGIGAAVGAVAVIAAIVAIIITRKHKRGGNDRSPSRAHLKISDPMPGSGRVYANERGNGFDNSELEMKSRRYEDMVPRHVPRNMV